MEGRQGTGAQVCLNLTVRSHLLNTGGSESMLEQEINGMYSVAYVVELYCIFLNYTVYLTK